MSSKHLARVAAFLLGSACISLVASSCSSDGVASIESRDPGMIDPQPDLVGPPRWASPGERRREAESDTDTLNPRLSAFRKESPLKYGYPGSPRLARFLFYFTETPGTSVEESVAETFNLPAEAARLAVRATFAQTAAWKDSVLEGSVSTHYAEAERHYWEAIELAPREWVLYESLGKLYSASPQRCDMDGIERLGERWGDRREALLRLAPIVIGSDECEDLYHALLPDYPEDIQVLGLLARRFDSNWHAAAFGIAVRQVALELASEHATSAALRLTIDRGLIHALLSSGQGSEALALWESRSEDDRNRMLGSPNAFERVFPSGFRGIDGRIDEALALELAAAYLVAGRTDRALSLMPSPPKLPSPSADKSLLYRHSTPHACYRLLAVALGEQVDDSFEFLLELAGGGEMFSDTVETCHHNDTWIQLSRQIAREAGYPRFEAAFKEDEVNPFETSSFEYFEQHDKKFLSGASTRLREHYNGIRSRFEIADAPDRSADLPAQTQRAVDARFESPFTESSASDAASTNRPSTPLLQWIANAARSDTNSSGDVVRTDRRGDLVARVHLNQDVDPMGEVGGGGYWLSFSPDGGKRWTRRFYTGLRAHFPYVVESESEIPILAGEMVQLAVEIEEIDTSTISFPPIGLGSKRREAGRLLTVSLEALAKDSDTDGLTDLLERALLLDPASSDSDGDGLPDAFDALPRTPYRLEADSARADALKAAIPHLFGSGLHARVVAPVSAADFDDAHIERALGSPVGEGSERTLFVVGDNVDFSAISVAARVVVLSPEESAAIDEHTGVFYPISIGLFILDHDERRGYLGWGGGWTGGALGFKRIFGRWTVEVLSHWMT
ncbi:MAG: hypothetical protein NXI30_18890 [bacterium]|nr:hypothetical protein [bacterium]